MVGGVCMTTFSATLCTSRLTASTAKFLAKPTALKKQALDGAIDALLLFGKSGEAR